MEISDIQLLENGKIEITFCSLEDQEDIISIKLDRNAMWNIAKFCHNKLSYGAELRSKK
ncbi:hypothetical protein M0P65_07885 [Candidatus Gracilibacteria bacterium]|jgi:hypothetical protein|nr:hypothetical protein [Candidatus Gracilibacteria bacterium]